ncbi:MAG: alanine--tRNA ligase [Caldisericia bacterium]|nr:alanine--tRNA ligase [Caldisericia bacterium]
MSLTSSSIRSEFLKFFEERDHIILPSFSLIPKDPTLLFTAAGMVPLKSYFLGEEEPPKKRIATCQACIRTNDIEQVGRTIRHHTFFEMLGNFSIGDYFKEEAISWAYTLLTKNWGLDKEKIWVSIYPDDDEALDIWKKVGIPVEKIVRLPDNFWQMGEEGPCGPDSEIYYDLGEEFYCSDPSLGPKSEGDRFLEVWNLVFTQFDRKKDGTLTPLPRKNIDTGMGLERITMVLQNKKSNFETDLFSGIIENITKVLSCDYDEKTKINIRVIADHIRAITFLISENLFPSNEGRGYVLRRLIRRAFSSGWALGARDPFLYKIYPSVVEKFKEPYSFLRIDGKIERVILSEERNFIETLEKGIDIIENLIKKALEEKKREISGKDIFYIYDTFGLPAEVVEDILSSRGLNYNKEEFEIALNESREKSRKLAKGLKLYEESLDFIKIKEDVGETEFIGYERIEGEAEILVLMKNGERVEKLKEGDEGLIILNKTPFYGEKGGQVGDTGEIKGENLIISVLDTKSPVENFIVHVAKVIKGEVKEKDKVYTFVDRKRRDGIKRAHTATHLLHKALREILGEHATQKGSLVSEDYLRFDFSHFSELTEKEITQIENKVNNWIYEKLPVLAEIKNIEEAKKEGAIALFGEKYSQIVRVISVDEITKEFCGGTHVSNSIEIGGFKIISERGIGTNLRRIEGITGLKVLDYLSKLSNDFKNLSISLSAKEDEVLAKVDRLKENIKELENTIKTLKERYFEKILEDAMKNVIKIKDTKLIFIEDKTLNPQDGFYIFDKIKVKDNNFIFIFISSKDLKNISIFISDLVSEKINAKEILNFINSKYGGKGGGKEKTAQGKIERIDLDLKEISDYINEKI